MKKKLVKISQATKVCIIIISLLLIALIVVYYLGFVKDTEKDTEMHTDKVMDNNTSTIVPTSELVTLYYEADNRLFYAYIEDGCLYYFNDCVKSFVTPASMQKYPDLSNIKRMKTYNLGTDVNPVPFLITEEGQVYSVNFYADKGIEVDIYEGLKGYAVQDIISHSGELRSVFEVLLKDGTTTKVECENY